MSSLQTIVVHMTHHLEVPCFRSEFSPNSPIVRATRSTFSRKPFVVSLASRTVEVANDLRFVNIMYVIVGDLS